MVTLVRYLTAQVEADLQRKMVFVAGARQVGTTTLAKSLPFRTERPFPPTRV